MWHTYRGMQPNVGTRGELEIWTGRGISSDLTERRIHIRMGENDGDEVSIALSQDQAEDLAERLAEAIKQAKPVPPEYYVDGFRVIQRFDGGCNREVARFNIYAPSTRASDYADYLNRKYEEDAL